VQTGDAHAGLNYTSGTRMRCSPIIREQDCCCGGSTGINVLTSRFFLALRRVSKYMLRKLFFACIYALFKGSPGDSTQDLIH